MADQMMEPAALDTETTECTSICDETGSSVITAYSVFDGIELIYNDIDTDICSIKRTTADNILQIDHCSEGRVEYETDGEFCYLTSGDMAVSRSSFIGCDSYFPTGHYRGISVTVDLDRAPKCLSCFLDDVNVSPDALAKKFCSGNSGYIVRAEESIAHIFSELYSIPESIRKGYFKVKIMELFLFLSAMDTERNESIGRRISGSHAALAKEVCRYLTDNLDKRLTLDQVAEKFHVSGTQIKNSFRAVYGMSMYAYIRAYKMESAASMLTGTQSTILEIAGEYGYENASKFASAFRTVMGMSPHEYRIKKHSKKCPNGVEKSKITGV